MTIEQRAEELKNADPAVLKAESDKALADMDTNLAKAGLCAKHFAERMNEGKACYFCDSNDHDVKRKAERQAERDEQFRRQSAQGFAFRLYAGLCSGDVDGPMTRTELAYDAVKYADALLEELSKPKP